jgi:ATP/maltotriose-dependent transcriptional regulator MalT
VGGLTERELDVLGLVCRGRRTRQIAAELQVNTGTVRWCLRNIYRTLGVSNRRQAIAVARRGDPSAPALPAKVSVALS